MRFSRRLRPPLSVLAVAALAAGLLPAVTGTAQAAAAPVLAAPAAVTEARDFASGEFADPWDFSQPEDAAVAGTPATISGGQLHYSPVTQPQLLYYVPGAKAWGRAGALHPVDAGTYRHLTVRLRTTDPKYAVGLAWQTCGDDSPSCRGFYAVSMMSPAVTPAGSPAGSWVLLDLDIPTAWGSQTHTAAYPQPWSGHIQGLRLWSNGAKLDVDWIRLTQPSTGGNTTVRWTDPTPGRSTTVYWDADSNPANNTASNPGWGKVATVTSSSTNTATFASSVMPAGYYRLWVDAAGSRSAVQVLDLRARPRPVVLSPDAVGGADYGAVVRHNAYDYNDAADVSLRNAAVVSRADGILSATNTNNDPNVLLPMAGAFDGSTYHRVRIKVALTGNFSLSGSPGGGCVGRILWETAAGGSTQWQTSDDLVLRPGWNDVILDMATSPAAAITDPAQASIRLGWAGQRITAMRFDPHEDPGARTFRIDEIRVAADAASSSGYFDVSYQDRAWRAGERATVTAVDAVSGAVVKVGDYQMTQGANTARFYPPSAGRTWRFRIDVADDAGPAQKWSSGPAKITGSAAPTVAVTLPAASPAGFVPITPTRILDTRSTLGATGPVTAGRTIVVDPATAGVPHDATAVVMTVTATDVVGTTYVTVHPNGVTRPVTSNLNLRTGQTIANSVTVQVGLDGKVALFNAAGSTSLVADVTGYYRASGGAAFVPLTPRRVLDTRATELAGPRHTPLGQGESATFGAGVPAGATAVALTITGTGATDSTYVTVWPADRAKPLASVLNLGRGQTVPDLAIVGLDPQGRFSLFNAVGRTDLIVDVTGYFAPGTPNLVAMTPVRVLDTRSGVGAVEHRIGAHESVTFDVGHVAAVVLNVTGVGSTAATFVTAYPADAARPLASNLNLFRGDVRPNGVVVGTSDGRVTLYNDGGTVDLVVDLLGTYR